MSETMIEARVEQPSSAVATQAVATLTQIQKMVITTPQDAIAAGDLLRGINKRWNDIEAQRVEIVKPFLEGQRRLQAFFSGENGPLTILKNAKDALNRKIVTYNQEQERIRKAAQAKLDAEAAEKRRKDEAAATEVRRKAEEAAAEIRRKAEAEAAETRRIANEAAAAGRAEEAARLQREAAATQAAAETKASAKVEKAETKALAFEERATTTVAPVVTTAAPKLTGVHTRKVWKWRMKQGAKITDVKPDFLMTNDTDIGKVVRALGMSAEALVGGIEVYEEEGLASRAS